MSLILMTVTTLDALTMKWQCNIDWGNFSLLQNGFLGGSISVPEGIVADTEAIIYLDVDSYKFPRVSSPNY